MSQLLSPVLNVASSSSPWRAGASADSAQGSRQQWESALKQSLAGTPREKSASRQEPAADHAGRQATDRTAAKDAPRSVDQADDLAEQVEAEAIEDAAEDIAADGSLNEVVTDESSPDAAAELMAMAGMVVEAVQGDARSVQMAMTAAQGADQQAISQVGQAGMTPAATQGESSDGESQQNGSSSLFMQAIGEAEGEESQGQAKPAAHATGPASAGPAVTGSSEGQVQPAVGVAGPQGVDAASNRLLEVAGPVAQAGLDEAAQDEMDPNVARVAQGLRGAMNLKGGSITIRLNPQELGFVRIEMEIQGGTVRAELQSENASVRDLLTHQLGRLRETLAGRGLVVERLEVAAPSSADASQAGQQEGQDASGDGRSRGQFFNQRQSSSHQQDAGDLDAKARRRFEQLLVDMVG